MKIFTLLVLLFLLASGSYSQDEWSLKKCLEYAVENSYDVYQSDLNIEDSHILTDLSKKERHPNLTANSNVNWNLGRSIDPTSNSFINTTFFSNGYSINTGATLYQGGRISNTIKQNQILEQIAGENKSSTINTLMLNVVNNFFEVLFAQDNLQNVLLQLKTIDDQIDQMQKLVSAGSRAEFELYDLQAQKANSEQDKTIAQNRIDLAFLGLKGLMNLPSDFDIRLKKPDFNQEVFTNLDMATLDEVFEKAMAFQPNAKSLDYQIKSAAVGVEVAKSSFYPSVSAGIGVNTNYSNQAQRVTGGAEQAFSSNVLINNQPAEITTSQFVPTFEKSPYLSQVDDNFSYGFGFNVGIPIYNRGVTKANVQRAKLNLENIQTEKSKYDVELKNLMMQILTDARAAKKSFEASKKTLEAREIASNNAKKRYNLGAISSYEYISIQDQLNTARTNNLLSEYDFMLKVKLLDYYQGLPIWLD